MDLTYAISSGLISALTLGGMSWLLPGVRIANGWSLLLAMVLGGLVNSLGAWGLGSLNPRPSLLLCAVLWLVVNTLVCGLVFGRFKGLQVVSLGAALINPLCLAAMNVLLGGAFGLY